MHELVDVTVEVAVEHVRRRRRKRATDQGGDDEPRVRNAALREKHDREGRDEQKLDDARLGERDVVTDDRLEGTLSTSGAIRARGVGVWFERCHDVLHECSRG